jgi:hypothetical protein
MKLNVLKTILTVTLGLIFYINADAKCRREATVKYQQEYGWSKKYTVEVSFMTGLELVRATNSFDYDLYSVYAIIFWGRGQAAVIKIKNFLPCGGEVTCDCITSSVTDLQGYDQDGDKWNICLNDYCF